MDFYQWDIDRKLIIEDNSINQVHFCNRTDSCSLVCEVYEENGQRLVNVPNVLLQNDWRINVYGYDKNYTKHSAVFDVVKRTKPADYVYTETEVKTYTELEERIDKIEETSVSEEKIGEAVEKYLDENNIQVDVDLSEYYTKTETDTAIEQAVAAIEIPSTAGLATEKYVDEKIEAIEIPEPDLSEYAKKTDIPSTTGLATEKYVDDAIASLPSGGESESVEEVYVGANAPTDANVKLWIDTDENVEYALKTDIPDTTGFITSIPDEYITETELEEALANIPTGGGGGSADIDVFQPIKQETPKVVEANINGSTDVSIVTCNPTLDFINTYNLQPGITYYLYAPFDWSATAYLGTSKGSNDIATINWDATNGYFVYGNQVSTGIKVYNFYNTRENYLAFQLGGVTPGVAGLVPAPTESDTDKYLYSDGTWKKVDMVQPKDWIWVEGFSDDGSVYNIDKYSHIKVVAVDKDNTKRIFTFDITTNSNNTFAEETSSYYMGYWYDAGGSVVRHVVFYNHGSYFTLEQDLEQNTNRIRTLGHYYWG